MNSSYGILDWINSDFGCTTLRSTTASQHTTKLMLTRGKKQKSDQTEQIDMAEPDKSDGKGVTTLDDLLKEIKKNQKTTETIQEQLNSINPRLMLTQLHWIVI